MPGTLPAALLLAAASMAFGQSAPAAPSFEVASVKPAGPMTAGGRGSISRSIDPGRVTYNRVTLLLLLVNAYKVKDYQISGPAWISQERYDVAAKVPDNTPKDEVPLMLQNLLAERFHLVLHHEQKILPSYALVAGSGGFKLKPVEEAREGLSFGMGPAGQRLKGKITLAALASLLSSFVGNPVVDATGIPGTFDFNLQWTPDEREQGIGGMKFTAQPGAAPGPVPAADAPVPGPSLFAAIQELGLKLEPRKTPFDILVIDHAEKIPTEN